VRDALSRLPDLYREVVVLRHYQHMKFEEIGRMLQIPRGTVASRMAKALRLLERELASYGFSDVAHSHQD
jgi:RNA polymerase sigma-70 factor (ECF subfamily)